MSIFDKVFDSTVPAIGKSLDLYWARNKAITSNIANAETPGYRAIDLQFAGELKRAFGVEGENQVEKTNMSHLDISSSGRAHLVTDFSGMTKADGNNVDLDIQMGKLTYNSGLYSQGANLVRKKLFVLRNAIRELMR